MAHRTSDHLSELAAQIQRGDEGAFEQLFRECHAPLCEVVDSYVHSQDVAEEIVQDLFFVLWLKRANWPIAESTLGYLAAAARNRALHHLRRRSMAQRWAAQVGDDAAAAAMSQPAPQPDEAVEATEAALALRRAIDGLPARSRLAVVLRWDHGMSYGEVATMMGISVKGVEKLLTGAKHKLRRQLGARSPHSIPLMND